MVAGELLEVAVAEAVAAAVAGVGDVELAVLAREGGGDHGRAHAAVDARVVGAGEDAGVGLGHGGAQALDRPCRPRSRRPPFAPRRCGSSAAMVLAAMRLATSPDWCPPMPSATT